MVPPPPPPPPPPPVGSPPPSSGTGLTMIDCSFVVTDLADWPPSMVAVVPELHASQVGAEYSLSDLVPRLPSPVGVASAREVLEVWIESTIGGNGNGVVAVP